MLKNTTVIKEILFKDTLKAVNDKKEKKCVKFCFLTCKSSYIFWKFVKWTLYWDKTQISSEKVKNTKNALFFLSQAPTLHRFTFNSRFLYELKHKVWLSKAECGIFHFRFRFVFIKVYIIFPTKSMDSLTLKRHNSFQI